LLDAIKKKIDKSNDNYAASYPISHSYALLKNSKRNTEAYNPMSTYINANIGANLELFF
jgi:hypothetical protein